VNELAQQITIAGAEFVAIQSGEGCSYGDVNCWFLERKDIDPATRCPRNERDLLRCSGPTYEVIFMKPEDFLKARMRGDV